MKEFIRSKVFKGVLIGIGAVVVLLLVFMAGLHLGSRKASFSSGLGDNFSRTFGEPRRGFMGMDRGGFPDMHGATGKIIKVTLPTLVIEGIDSVEKTVLVSDKTAIREFRDTLKPTDLKEGDQVVVIGSPDDQSRIVATLIRLMPAPGNGDTPLPPPPLPLPPAAPQGAN